jgi:hypothetical protein
MRSAGNSITTVHRKAIPAIDRSPDRCTIFIRQAPGAVARRDAF